VRHLQEQLGAAGSDADPDPQTDGLREIDLLAVGKIQWRAELFPTEKRLRVGRFDPMPIVAFAPTNMRAQQRTPIEGV